MATIAKLREEGTIRLIELELDGREQPCRLLFGTPDFIAWLEERQAADEASPSGAELIPLEQIDALFSNFISGAQLHHTRQFRALKPTQHSVWELKTRDLRIFGWFLQRDVFLAVFGQWTDHVKDYSLYHGYLNEVARIRENMGLTECLCVHGENPNDVISV